MYANTVINIHLGTDGDINVDTDALVERVSTTSAPIATVLIATSTDKQTITLLKHIPASGGGNSEHYDLFQGKRTMKAKRWQYGYNLIVATFDKYSLYCY